MTQKEPRLLFSFKTGAVSQQNSTITNISADALSSVTPAAQQPQTKVAPQAALFVTSSSSNTNDNDNNNNNNAQHTGVEGTKQRTTQDPKQSTTTMTEKRRRTELKPTPWTRGQTTAFTATLKIGDRIELEAAGVTNYGDITSLATVVGITKTTFTAQLDALRDDLETTERNITFPDDGDVIRATLLRPNNLGVCTMRRFGCRGVHREHGCTPGVIPDYTHLLSFSGVVLGSTKKCHNKTTSDKNFDEIVSPSPPPTSSHHFCPTPAAARGNSGEVTVEFAHFGPK